VYDYAFVQVLVDQWREYWMNSDYKGVGGGKYASVAVTFLVQHSAARQGQGIKQRLGKFWEW